ncbi:MAG: 30S ribosomal protein S6 [Chloroflexota bacterium]|nr:30S ribosomal protein S6 [Chloroflexota bacterium]
MVKRNYELMFIVTPELDDEGNVALLQRVQDYLEEAGGAIIKRDDWGVRRLAYSIKKQREGHYYLLQFTADSSKVKAFERRILLTNSILREIVIQLDDVPSGEQGEAL